MAAYPKFIYITGCDGTGKTTQAGLLIEEFRNHGIDVKHLWLRFPFFFSIPLLLYARLGGYSWYEITNGVRHGYWDFRKSWLLRVLFPWFLLFDAALSAIGTIYIPLLIGKTLVCERFVLDMLADMMVAFGSKNILQRYPGKLFPKLIPSKSKIAVLILDEQTICLRRSDLNSDKRLGERLEMYQLISSQYSLPAFSSTLPPRMLNELLLDQLNQDDE